MSIEVEMRGPLSEDDHKRLGQFLKEKATLKKEFKRLLIDYSDYLFCEVNLK